MPRISGTQAVKAFEKAGWRNARQSGSHVVLIKEGSALSLSIPLHRELGPGLLRDQIGKSGLSVDEFIALL
ncbi:MAG: type II toxin-antitoxin system HicA family toxin [Dehalococcoidia bacterium]